MPRLEGAVADKAMAIWKRVESPFHALTGRDTTLVVLSPEARIGEGSQQEPVPPAAYICPGTPPTVYVPSTLLALIDNADTKKYPDDFLAFVLGHELGHRMNDLTSDGCELAAFQRPGQGVNEESLADARSAFFITTTGFSANRIARDDMVSRFLEAEYALGRTQTKGRRDSLLGALTRFDDYEALYQAGLAIAMTGELEAADRMLSWADELVESHGILLPELRVVRAITRIERASKIAPWLAAFDLPVSIDRLHCTPLHPGHSGLWQEPDQRVRGEMARGRKLLEEALVLLDEAEARGATPFTVATARACAQVYFTVATARACAQVYLADAAASAREQERAERLLPGSASATVKSVLAANRALVSFVGYARAHKTPAVDDNTALGTWADGLAAAVGDQVPASLQAVIAAVRDPSARRPAPTSDAPACSGGKKVSTSLPALPAATAQGACPTGFSLAHVLRPKDDKAASQGLTVCSGANDSQLLAVHLPATATPKQRALDRTILAMRPPAELRELAAWACSCAELERQGVSDRGEVVYFARCPPLQLEQGLIVVSESRVDGVIAYSR